MRVLFVKVRLTPGSPLGGFENSVLEPLEFEYLATRIPDHDVRLIDLRREPDGALLETLEFFRPHILASTANTVDVYSVQDVFRTAKAVNPNIITVVGGYHATFSPIDFADGVTDVVVIGPGEETFRELVNRVERGSRTFMDIPGLALPSSDGITKTADRPLSCLNDDLPVRDLTQKYRHSYHCEFWMPAAMVRNTWGCPYRCSFCALWSVAGGRIWERDVERLCEEIEQLAEKYVFFCDDLSFLPTSVERMERFCELVVQMNRPKQFYFTCRSDVVLKVPRLVEKLAEAGMRRVFLGLESHTDAGLEFWNKHNKVQINEEAIRFLHSLDVSITGSFIITPDYSLKDFEELFRYAQSIDILCPAFLIYTPHPGVEVHKQSRYRHVVANYEHYDHLHTLFETNLSVGEFYREFARLWQRSYSPFSRYGLPRFLQIARQTSPRLLVHTLKMTLGIFSRVRRGHLLIDRFENRDKHAGRPGSLEETQDGVLSKKADQ